MISIFLLVGVFGLLCYFAIKPFKYWAKRNVVTGTLIPIIGENLWIMLGKESVIEMIQRVYNTKPNLRYSGFYQFQNPVLNIRCPDLIKQICVKDFDHFLNHRLLIPDGVEELWSKNLIALKDQHWKIMRTTLSPSFTSSKMKLMYVSISHKAKSFANFFLEKNENQIEIEFKDAFTRYTNDVIASSAFGIEVNSLENRNNEFYTLGREAGDFSSPIKKIKFFFYQLFPSVARFFKITFFGSRARKFFLSIVKDTIQIRVEQNIKRPDMLGLLLEAKNGHGQQPKEQENITESSYAAVEEHLKIKDTHTQRDLSESDIAAQVFIFFIAGFETVSTAMCFMAYELAANPDIQKRLIEEIDQNGLNESEPSYETIANMAYLDMVVCETLRKWPVNIATDRVVTKPYTIEPTLPGEKPVNLDVNDLILIPVIAIHRDPKYYQNPEKFDPERFSIENRKTITPYTYLPFGVGPRNCIGSRFALLEIKLVFYHLLSHFEIVPVEKTQIPIKISKTSLTLTSENGFHLGLKRRHLIK